jgi:hypothetical protein
MTAHISNSLVHNADVSPTRNFCWKGVLQRVKMMCVVATQTHAPAHELSASCNLLGCPPRREHDPCSSLAVALTRPKVAQERGHQAAVQSTEVFMGLLRPDEPRPDRTTRALPAQVCERQNALSETQLAISRSPLQPRYGGCTF